MKFDNGKLSSFLREKNMKQIEFAHAINRAPSTVSSYISGKGEPGRKALIAMSEVLDLPMHELLKSED